VQIDQWDILAEADWGRAIERMIRGCDNFLIILSPEAVNSWVVREQLLLALELKKNIVPILYSPCQIPLPLQHVSYVDFTGRDFKASFSQLLAGYFPNQKIEIGYWPILKMASNKLIRNGWHTLGPLLWPGWLGPAIFLFLLIIEVKLPNWRAPIFYFFSS